MNIINSVILRDHAPTQTFLHSIPIVSMLIRLQQSAHCFAGLDIQNHISVMNFGVKKERFKSFITTGALNQLVISISLVALTFFVPTVGGTLLIAKLFGIGAITSFIFDRFWRSERAAPTRDGVLLPNPPHPGGPITVIGW